MLRDCVAMAAMLGAAGVVRAQEPPAKQDASASLLDDLIAKSRRIHSFTARFTMQADDEPAPATIRCDYKDSVGCRLVIESSQSTISSWCIDRIVTIHLSDTEGDAPAKKSYARIDLRDFDEPQRALRAALASGFSEPIEELSTRSTMSMQWAFDTESNEGDFEICAGHQYGNASPFGWLETLRDKHAEPAVDGDALRYSTDGGRCEVVIAKENGFLREFVGRGDSKVLHVHLESVVLDPTEGIPEVDPPEDAAYGEDMTAACRAKWERDLFVGSRNYCYHVITSKSGDEPWSPELNEKMRRALQPVDDWMVHQLCDEWAARVRAWFSELAAALERTGKDTAPSSPASEWVEQSKANLLEQLSQTREGLLPMLTLPAKPKFPQRAARLLEIDREVLGHSFDTLVHDPLLADFAKATGTSQK